MLAWYQSLKALHIVAAVVLVGGMLMVAAALPTVAAADAMALARLRRLNRVVLTPALLLVWVLGATLAWSGGWFAAAWLQMKLPLVLVLTGLHGWQTARLRRGRAGARAAWWPPLAVLALGGAIATLASFKPV